MALKELHPLVLVTGATGAVGPLVVEALHEAGYRIRTLSLDAPPADAWPEEVEAQIGDVTDLKAVQKAMENVEYVIHLAALLHIVDPSPSLREHYERINVGGTSNVVDAAIGQNVKRIVFFSTIAVYGNSDGRILDENSLPQPDTFYAQTKLSAERIVLAVKNSSGEPIGTVLRLGAIYGSRVKGNYRQLLQALANGRFLPVGPGRNRRTLVYDKDVARAALLALEHPDAAGKIFNISDGQFHTLNEILSTMCLALGRKPPRLFLPVSPVRLAAGMMEDALRLLGRRSPITRSTIDKYTEDVAVESRRIQEELGFVPQFDLAAGWRDAIAGMRQRGEL